MKRYFFQILQNVTTNAIFMVCRLAENEKQEFDHTGKSHGTARPRQMYC